MEIEKFEEVIKVPSIFHLSAGGEFEAHVSQVEQGVPRYSIFFMANQKQVRGSDLEKILAFLSFFFFFLKGLGFSYRLRYY